MQGLRSAPGTAESTATAPAAPVRAAPAVAVAEREAPFVVRPGPDNARERANAAHQGWLLRSNSALGLAQVDGVPAGADEHGPLSHVRFATTNHVSIGYGWRANWALTLDGFRAVVPHYPHSGQKPEFEMRVDTESLGLGLGSTVYLPAWSLHLGSSMGFAMSRISGDSLHAPTHHGIGSLSFAGFELMRSQRIAVVLSAQVLGIVARRSDDWLTTRTCAVALGVTYW